MSRFPETFWCVGLLACIACTPNPKYPYDQEPDPRKQGMQVTQLESYEITVFGNVENPGTLHPDKFITVLEAIDLVGGLAPLADGDNIVIERKGQQIPFVYQLAKSGERPDMNLVLLPGDIVQVP